MSQAAPDPAPMDAKKRRLLEAALRKKGIDPIRLPIAPRGESGPAPLALAQEQLWVLSRLDRHSIAYHESYRAKIDGALDEAALAAAFAALVERHEVLRTRFEEIGGVPHQVADPAAAATFGREDLRPIAAGERRAAAERRIAELAAEPFDLLRGPLARATLLRLGEESRELILCLHHIVCDAASLANLGRELAALYADLAAGRPPGLPPLEIQYADYARWQREVQLPSVLETQLAYWREQLAGIPTLLDLPADRPRPALPGGRGGRASALLPAPLLAAVKALAAGAGATPYMLVLTAFGVLLARLSGRRDPIVGTPVGSRDRAELERLIGFFVNTLPLPLHLPGERSTRELLAGVRETVLGAFAHRDVPFVTLVEHLRPERSPSYPPLVQVMFLLQPPASELGEEGGLGLGLEPVSTGTAKFDLTFTLRERPEGLACEVEYSADLFDPATVEGLIGRFRTLLEGMVADPDRPVALLPILSAPEKLALARWNATAADTPVTTWPALFAAQAARTPEAAAVEAEGASLSYRQLAARSRRLAALLRRRGAGPEIAVGIALEPGIDMIVGLLAILEAGAAYVPLDPAYPRERLAAMIEATALPLVVTRAALAELLPLPPAALVCLDGETGEAGETGDPAATCPAGPAGPDNLAYVIFTSGSTGQPKGVMIEHRSFVNLVLAFVDAFRLGPGERALMLLPLSFDASIGDIFPALASGATVVIEPGAQALGAGELAELVESRRISVIESAAVFFQQWAEELGRRGIAPPAGLHTVVTGGDSADVLRVRGWLAGEPAGKDQPGRLPRRVLNNYGPTEATVCSASLAVGREEAAGLATPRLPIGRPLPNVEVHILDGALQPVPPGVVGEIYLGGRGVGRGYIGRPAATAERFVPDPFAAGEAGRGARLYRTGDLARRLPDGNFEFAGRVDDQVKVRGFRIEPAEVEAALLAHPAVREAAVKAAGRNPEDRRLVGYVVAAAGSGLQPAELRSFLADSLPAHLVPSAFVMLAALPLTSSGKIDRRALPDPGAAPAAGKDGFAPPRGELEATIAALWRAVLGAEKVGAFDNFFDLGGTSLQLIQVQSRLSQALGREVPTVELFRHPSVDALARYLEADSRAPAAAPAAADAPAAAEAARAGEGSGHDIAVIGLSGRFPGAADVDAFWRNLCDGVESISFFSEEELLANEVPLDHIRHPDYVPAKGILDEPDLFDAAFFGISPRDAELMDPQQRLFLEAAWNAIESAGRKPEDCRRVGIFAGLGRDSYFVNNILSNAGLIESAGQVPVFLGNLRDYLATRVSYKFDLSGPAMTVQTACSTSLVAVHQAVRSLQHGECEMALAGGVTVAFPQKVGYVYIDGGIFSKDGHCRAFDLRAKGVVPGSGVGVVLLKRLDRALRDGDPIRAVIKGIAINNDGSEKIGFTAPSLRGQKDALEAALAAARVAPATVGMIEAHGTGTLLGDLIEGTVLDEVYGGRGGAPAELEPLAVGSLKSNVGHLDTAAGVSGLIKAVLALEHRLIPPSLHFEELNAKLDWSQGRLFVNSGLRDWPAPRAGHPRRAAVSSFGIGGTNAHAILEEAPPRPAAAAGGEWQLLPVSAQNAAALEQAVGQLARRLAEDGAPPLADAAFTLQTGRRAFGHRRFAVVQQNGREAAGEAGLRAAFGAPLAVADGPRPELVFLLPGSGAQHLEMGAGLYRHEPVFRATFDECAGLLATRLDGLDLRQVLFAEGRPAGMDAEALIARTRAAHPAIFAVEVALARLWQSWGIEPALLWGHSLGEYAAAYLAGVFSLEDAATLVAERGKLLDTLPAGAMISVPLGEAELLPYLGPQLSVAAVNLPGMCVAAGPLAEIEALAAALFADGIEGQRVPIAFAAHSPLVDGVLEAFGRVVAGLTLRPPRLPVVSSRSGRPLAAEEACDPAYWVRQLRETVRFADGMQRLLEDGTPRLFLEVGPGRALSALARRQPSFGAGHAVAASMRHRDETREDAPVLLEALGALWQRGIEPAWSGLHGAAARRRVVLPTYPFQRKRFWIAPGDAAATPSAAEGKLPRPAEWLYQPTFLRGTPPPARLPEGSLLLVGGGALAMALERRLAGGPGGPGALMRAADAEEAAAWLRVGLAGDSFWVVVEGLEALPLDDALQQVVTVARALAERAGQAAPEAARGLMLVGRGGPEVTGAEGGSAGGIGALLPGLAAALGRELPGVRCRSLDVEENAEADWLAERLLAELAAPAEGAVAYRHGRRWLAREEALAPAGTLAPAAAPAPQGRVAWLEIGAGDDAFERRLAETGAAGEVGALVCRLPAAGEPLARLDGKTLAAAMAAAREKLAAAGRTARALGVEMLAVAASLEAGLAAEGGVLPALLAAALVAPGWRRITLDDAPLAPGESEPALAPAESAEALRWAFASGADEVIVSAAPLLPRRRRFAAGRTAGASGAPEAAAAAGQRVAGRHPRPELDNDYAAPRSRDEKVLCEIWADLLGLDRVGIHDNFFDVGGDSVVALQVIARANQKGLKLTQRKTYHNQTIAELAVAAHLDPKVHAKQAPITSTVVVTAIQSWFFERRLAAANHWNFSVLFEIDRGIGAAEVGQAVRQIVFTHDALRATFHHDPAEGWLQRFAHPDDLDAFRVQELSALPADSRAAALEAIADRLQRGLDIEKGPLMHWVYFDYGPREAGRLLFVVHHLVVDAVSLRILIGDLADLLQAGRRGEALALPPKTTGLSHFAVRIPEWVRAGHLDDQIPYWLAEERRLAAPLPIDLPGGANTQESVATLHSALDAAETEALLRELPRAFRSEINDVLLTALAAALGGWTGGRRVLVDLEGHGREPVLEEIDLSRTVGWFTAPYPVLLPCPRPADDEAAAVQLTRQTLKAVPLGGVGYAMLRFLGRRPEVAAQLAALPQAELVFLYLGQLDRLTAGDAPIRGAAEPIGAARSLDNERSHLIETTVRIADGQLQASWSFSQNLHHRATIGNLASNFLAALRALLKAATAPAARA